MKGNAPKPLLANCPLDGEAYKWPWVSGYLAKADRVGLNKLCVSILQCAPLTGLEKNLYKTEVCPLNRTIELPVRVEFTS